MNETKNEQLPAAPCECGAQKDEHNFGDNAGLLTPCYRTHCPNYRSQTARPPEAATYTLSEAMGILRESEKDIHDLPLAIAINTVLSHFAAPSPQDTQAGEAREGQSGTFFPNGKGDGTSEPFSTVGENGLEGARKLRITAAQRELLCQRCDQEYPVWSAENDVWEKTACEGEHFFCPTCFVVLAEQRGTVTNGIWRLTAALAAAQQPAPDAIELVSKINALADHKTIMYFDGSELGYFPFCTARELKSLTASSPGRIRTLEAALERGLKVATCYDDCVDGCAVCEWKDIVRDALTQRAAPAEKENG